MTMLWVAVALGAVFAGWTAVALAYRRELAAAWREPVLKDPVLILESDDWGPGPEPDAERLEAVLGVLRRHRDGTGRAAVMTVGVLLGIADTAGIRAAARSAYHRLRLDDLRFAAILDALRRGRAEGLLALQLHDMEHYWPPALLVAAAGDASVRRWLETPGIPRHEELPAPLQTRWVDASALPSRPLSPGAVRRAVEEEIAAFRAILGEAAGVVVPPTFVWSAEAEAAWVANGVRVIVTPGRRAVEVRADGSHAADRERIHNGETTPSGATYLVRDDYFEPARGHRAERGLAALAAKAAAGRPALLEMHRSNFTGAPERAAAALGELDRLLATALGQFPRLRFMSAAELAAALRERRSDVVEGALRHRLNAWLARAGRLPRLRKLAWATGLAVPAGLVLALTREAPPAERLAGASR
jgi:hypothetical protein